MTVNWSGYRLFRRLHLFHHPEVLPEITLSRRTRQQDADFVGLLYKPNEEDDEKVSSPDALQVNLLIA